jgi:hypothetical protein
MYGLEEEDEDEEEEELLVPSVREPTRYAIVPRSPSLIPFFACKCNMVPDD